MANSPPSADDIGASGALPSRTINPRRGLPNGRAVVGGLLIAIAAIGAFAVATAGDDGPDEEFLILINDVEPGATIELGDVALAAMTLPPEVAASALRSTAGLEGASALEFLRAGEILDVRDLNGATFIDGEPITAVHELTLPVPRDRAPPELRRGDRVTVLAYTDQTRTLRLALEDALVLRYDTEATGIGSSEEGRLTLGLPYADLVLDSTLLSYEELTVVLTSRAIDDEYGHLRVLQTSEPMAEEVIE
jgi:hypothetical protein